MSIKYRPEIDGLRAIAVLSVVLYHAEFALNGGNPFAGGFIGVDIFFVISGYLITSIILKQVQAGNYSFRNFYERRARRILPALFAVMIASIPFAWALMLPKALKEYAGSVLSSLFFGSNFWFFMEDSYWAEPSALKPFLHTWSLSIEEQFYVIFPIIVLAVWKYAQKYLTGIFIIGFLISLQFADYGSIHSPDATFYLLPARAWELLAGAILAKLALDKGRISHPFLDMVMPALGLFLIGNAIFFFKDEMNHPSFITLLPILGTMLIIWFGNKGELVTDMLSSKPFVGIGLISYSLYLWHFPIFAFARIHDNSPTDLDRVLQILLSIVLATAAYYLIEQPARKPKMVGRRTFFAGISAVFMGLIVINAMMFKSDGMPSRFPASFADISGFNAKTKRVETLSNVEAFGQEPTFEDNGKTNIVVLGDSLSRDMWNALYETKFMEGDVNLRNIHIATMCFVPLVNGTDFAKASAKNPRVNTNCGPNFRVEFMDSNLIRNADAIVWTQLFNNKIATQLSGFGNLLADINPNAIKIVANRNDISFDKVPYQVLLTDEGAASDPNLPQLMSSYRSTKRDEARQSLEKLARDEDVYYLDVSSLACGENLDACPILDQDGKLLYYDAHHWTLEGARYFGQKIIDEGTLAQLISEKQADRP